MGHRKKNHRNKNRKSQASASSRWECQEHGRCPECEQVPGKIIVSATPVILCPTCNLIWPSGMCFVGLNRELRGEPLGECARCKMKTVKLKVHSCYGQTDAYEEYLGVMNRKSRCN